MPSFARPREHRHRVAPQVVELPTRRTLDGMIYAGVLVALADGAAHCCERQALIRFLRRNGLLARYGRRTAIRCFDEAADSLPVDLAALCDAADVLRSHATSHSAATLIVEAARQVMAADRAAWPQEVAMVRVIETRLGLAS